MTTNTNRKVVFLDRDGTLNVDSGYVYLVEQWQFTLGAAEAIAKLRNMGFAIAVVSNQSGIARGYFTKDQVETLHAFAADELRRLKAPVDCFVYCPHGPDSDCNCRKPRVGMVHEVEERLRCNLDLRSSWTIGDKISDMEFGRGLGTRTALIRSRYWQDGDLSIQPDVTANSFHDAVSLISVADGTE